MFRNTLLLVMLIGAGGMSAAQAEEPGQYEILKQHLLAGQRTTSILQLDKCEQTSGSKIGMKGLTGGFVIPSFMNVQEPSEAILYSDDHSTVHDDLPVHEFLRYRVASDQTAIITTKVFSSKTFEAIGETRIFKCKLGEGLTFSYQPD